MPSCSGNSYREVQVPSPHSPRAARVRVGNTLREVHRVTESGGAYITSESEKRKYPRLPIATQVQCKTPSRDELLLTREISAGGLFLKCEDPMPKDSEVTLSFCLASGGLAIQCRGRVVYSVVGVGMGVQFLDLGEESRRAIQTHFIAPPAPSSDGTIDVPMTRISNGRVPDAMALRKALMERCIAGDWTPDASVLVGSEEKATRPGREEFRALRSHLNLIRERQNLRRILITSALPEEGKSFVAANLAQAASWQNERWVLLVDADLRSSNLHLALGAPRAPGLSDYLNGDADEFGIIKRGSQPNFFLIPGGTQVSNPSEILENGTIKVLLGRIAPAFDWIFIDTPPVVPIPDAKVIAELCDGVLVVVSSGNTPFDLAQKAYSEFPRSPFVGVVLNRVDPRVTYGYRYNYEGKVRATGDNETRK
jgi:protein-tyrosine kinase